MPFKNLEKRREYRRKWYSLNSDSEKEHVKRRKKELRNWLSELKKELKCSNCSERHPATLEFHHKNRLHKKKNISLMIDSGFSKKKILDEIKKCIVLCANCHRKLHYKSKNL